MFDQGGRRSWGGGVGGCGTYICESPNQLHVIHTPTTHHPPPTPTCLAGRKSIIICRLKISTHACVIHTQGNKEGESERGMRDREKERARNHGLGRKEKVRDGDTRATEGETAR